MTQLTVNSPLSTSEPSVGSLPQAVLATSVSPVYTLHKTITVTSSPTVVQQVLHMRRRLSGRVRADGKVLIERASVLGASNMRAVHIRCVLVQVEDLIVNCGEDIALGGAVAAT